MMISSIEVETKYWDLTLTHRNLGGNEPVWGRSIVGGGGGAGGGGGILGDKGVNPELVQNLLLGAES